MNNQRKETIIKEIEYWKASRLLPEQYCDYLLALYTEGQEAEQKRTPKSKKLLSAIFACLIPLFVPITFLVIYFTEMSNDLQMVLISFFILFSIIGYIVFRREHFYVHIPVIVIILLFLILSINFLETQSFPLPLTFGLITIQAIIWFAIGYLKKWYYLNIAAIVSTILLVVKIILM